MRFFGFVGPKPVVVHNRWGTRLIWIMWRPTRYAHYRRSPISLNLKPRRGSARPVSPLNSSYHEVSTVALFLLDCSGLLPIPGHLIGVSQRRRRGSGVCRFGAKETQPLLELRMWRKHPSFYNWVDSFKQIISCNLVTSTDTPPPWIIYAQRMSPFPVTYRYSWMDGYL